MFKRNVKKIRILHNKIRSLKKELSKIRQRQLSYYYDLLKEGLDCRQEGLCWIIKAIWYLRAEVNPEHFPNFINDHGINFLIGMAKLSARHSEILYEFKTIVNHNRKSKVRNLTTKNSNEWSGITLGILAKINKTKFMSTRNLMQGPKVPKTILSSSVIFKKYQNKEEKTVNLANDNVISLTSELDTLKIRIKNERRMEAFKIIREYKGNEYCKKYGVNKKVLAMALLGEDGAHLERFNVSSEFHVVSLPFNSKRG